MLLLAKIDFFVWGVGACSYNRKIFSFRIESTRYHVFRYWRGQKPPNRYFWTGFGTFGPWTLPGGRFDRNFVPNCIFWGYSPQEWNFWLLKSANMINVKFSIDWWQFYQSISIYWYLKIDICKNRFLSQMATKKQKFVYLLLFSGRTRHSASKDTRVELSGRKMSPGASENWLLTKIVRGYIINFFEKMTWWSNRL